MMSVAISKDSESAISPERRGLFALRCEAGPAKSCQTSQLGFRGKLATCSAPSCANRGEPRAPRRAPLRDAHHGHLTPRINVRDDLLGEAVARQGGYESVEHQKKWAAIASRLGMPKSMAEAIKRRYEDMLRTSTEPTRSRTRTRVRGRDDHRLAHRRARQRAVPPRQGEV